MPNHCQNYLRLAESPERIHSLLAPFFSSDAQGEKSLDLEKILPMPPGIRATCSPNPSEPTLTRELREEENTKNYGYADWYAWRCGKWGTKWSTYENSLTDTCLAFCSAWSPPLGAIEALAKITQETWILEYLEEGCDFIGRASISPEGIYDECYPLADAPDELKDALGYMPAEEDCGEYDPADFADLKEDISTPKIQPTNEPNL